METKLDLTIEFVKASQGGGIADNVVASNASSNLAQTGDPILFGTVTALIVLLIGLWGGVFAYYRKKHAVKSSRYDYVKDNITTRQHSFLNVFLTLFKNTIVVIASCVVAAMLMVVGLSCTFSKSAYADESSKLTPSTNKIVATVNVDGTISCSSIYLKNNENKAYSLKSTTVSLNEDLINVSGISDTKLTIAGFGCDKVFDGVPTVEGFTYTPSKTDKLDVGESTELSFKIHAGSSLNFNELYNKPVYTLSLNVVPYEVETTTLNFKNIDGLDYYPVFDTVPEGAVFYNSDETETYTSMNIAIDHAKVPVGTQITAVRSINHKSGAEIPYNLLYGEHDDTTSYPLAKNIDKGSDWYNNNIKPNETVENLLDNGAIPDFSNKYEAPKISGVSLTAIWKAYNDNTNDGFGGKNGDFWSCVAKDAKNAYNWYAGMVSGKSMWNNDQRQFSYTLSICISRVFGNSSKLSVDQCINNDINIQYKSDSESQNINDISSKQTHQSIINTGQQTMDSDNIQSVIDIKDTSMKDKGENSDKLVSSQNSSTTITSNENTQINNTPVAQEKDSTNGETSLINEISSPV